MYQKIERWWTFQVSRKNVTTKSDDKEIKNTVYNNPSWSKRAEVNDSYLNANYAIINIENFALTRIRGNLSIHS